MTNSLLILFGKSIILFSKTFNLGNGSTWPGHIALSANKNFIKQLLSSPKTKNQRPTTIFIAGTNGKTTTTKLIKTILEKNGKKVFQNEAGANLLNGIASLLVSKATFLGKLNCDYILLEIDENTLPLAISEIKPDYLILLNLFRDQLDRYGEVNIIASKWKKAVAGLPKESVVLLNADDPQIASLGSATKAYTFYFGLNNKNLSKIAVDHAVDSTYCPYCQTKLTYSVLFFSHLGIWKCPKCKEKRPELNISQTSIYPLPGIYNKYNTLAAVLLAKIMQFNETQVHLALKGFTPAFGRQEILNINGKKVQLFLSKNPTSFNQSIRTIVELGGKQLLIVLNDRIPDGRDVSWIWDADLEDYIKSFDNLIVSGDRCYDMGLRVKYAQDKFPISNFKFQIEDDLKTAVKIALENTPEQETLFILPTYSAMLDVRKILTGKKIL